jgi:hypothetical protein
LPGYIYQFHGIPAMQPPPPDRLPNRFSRLRTDSRKESDEKLPILGPRAPRTEMISQEVELAHRIACLPIARPAVDNLCLLRMQLQMALSQPHLKGRLKRQRFLQTAAMTVSSQNLWTPAGLRFPKPFPPSG